MLKIAVLVSGGGTNLQALIDAQNRGEIQNGKVALVLSSKPDVYALTRAHVAGIPTAIAMRKSYETLADYDKALIGILRSHQIDLVVLAGFMTIIGETFIRAFENHILNVHPALIPSFCGQGFYGLHVHQAALERAVKLTGATVHFVNAICDGGPIVLQKSVPVLDSDTPETLQKRVMEEAEWDILPKAVSLFCQGKLAVEGNRVHVLE